MAGDELVFSRRIDLPAAIVWDALVDDVLVDGWLAPARIEARLGGAYELDWQIGTGPEFTHGVITEFLPSTRLAIETDNLGSLEFTLEVTEGGTRGTGTELTLRLGADTHRLLLASTEAYWQSNFDQLEELLRGHPVDWSTWQRDRGEVWAAYLRAASMEG
ncbi:MAG TPA: SRPBCC domain-containing protein [Galbitalea sp.]